MSRKRSKRLGSLLFKIAGILTAMDSNMKNAVDHVVGTLVNETVKDLGRFITVFTSQPQSQSLYDKVQSVE